MCNHPHNPCLEHLHHPKKKFHTIKQLLSFPLFHNSLETTNLFFLCLLFFLLTKSFYFGYIITSWWTVGLTPLGYYLLCCDKHSCASLWMDIFFSWVYIHRSEIAGSYGKLIFNLFMEILNCFPKRLYHFYNILTSIVWQVQLIHLFVNEYVFIIALLVGVQVKRNFPFKWLTL